MMKSKQQNLLLFAVVSYGDETQHQFPYQEAIKARDGNKMVNPADKAFSQNFVKLWTSFATHG